LRTLVRHHATATGRKCNICIPLLSKNNPGWTPIFFSLTSGWTAKFSSDGVSSGDHNFWSDFRLAGPTLFQTPGWTATLVDKGGRYYGVNQNCHLKHRGTCPEFHHIQECLQHSLSEFTTWPCLDLTFNLMLCFPLTCSCGIHLSTCCDFGRLYICIRLPICFGGLGCLTLASSEHDACPPKYLHV
jgi:hypothetical protein